MASQLGGAFLAGLVLIVPLRAALVTSSFGALLGWIAAAMVAMVLFGLLLRIAGVPQGLGVALLTFGAFSVVAMMALVAVAIIGDPGGYASVALTAGIPAAAVAAPAAVAAARYARDDGGATAVGVMACVAGLLLTGVAGPGVGELVEDARQDAATIRALEDAGLTPYLPEMDGTRVEFAYTSSVSPEGGARRLTGYGLRYEPESAAAQDFDSASISVDVEITDDPACEPIADYLACREGEGYVVTERDGVAEKVSADNGGVRLEATIQDGTGELPDLDDIGKALAEADQSDWKSVLTAS